MNQVTLSFCHGIFYFKGECENRGKLWPRVLRANVDVTLTLLHIRTATRWIVIYLIPGDNSFESSLHYERMVRIISRLDYHKRVFNALNQNQKAFIRFQDKNYLPRTTSGAYYAKKIITDCCHQCPAYFCDLKAREF